MPSSRPTPNGNANSDDSVEKKLKSKLQKLISDAIKKGKVIAAEYSPKIKGKRPNSYRLGKDNGVYEEFKNEINRVFDTLRSVIGEECSLAMREVKDPKVVERIKQMSRDYDSKAYNTREGIKQPLYRKADLVY